jgi:RNA polymerase sigma-70 factor (ECF subfamily)
MRDDEFEGIVRRHAQDVYAFLLYRIGDHHVAEDVLADALERAYRHRSRFDPRRGAEKTWLIAIALNRWRDLVRREVSEQSMLERLGGDSEAWDDIGEAEDRRELLDALAQLPADERDVVALTYGADLTAKQIAHVLDLPATTVQGRLYRGLRHMHAALAEVAPPESGERLG